MKKAILIALAITALAAPNANALSLTVGPTGTLILGEVIPTLNDPGSAEQDAVDMINVLIGMALNTRSASGVNPEYYRSNNSFSPLPTAVTTGALNSGTIAAGAATLSFTLPQGFTYLLAIYDGLQGGTQAWYIRGAGTTFDIPRYAEPQPASQDCSGKNAEDNCGADEYPQDLVVSTQYKISHYIALNPTGSVPDGGATAALLGSALFGLGLLRRKFGKK